MYIYTAITYQVVHFKLIKQKPQYNKISGVCVCVCVFGGRLKWHSDLGKLSNTEEM